jgi:hypothetical protein
LKVGILRHFLKTAGLLEISPEKPADEGLDEQPDNKQLE